MPDDTAKTFSMKLFDKYVKSATYGATYTQRFKRVLLIICIIIWVLGLVWIYEPTVNGFKAISEYSEAKNYIKDRKQNLDKYELALQYLHEQNPYDTLSAEMFEIVTNKNKPLPDWLDKEITAYANKSDGTETKELEMAKNKMWGLAAIPTYFALFFLAPWLIFRLIFWIKNADNVKRV